MTIKLIEKQALICDYAHKKDTEGERLFVTDSSGTRFSLDVCGRHRGHLPLRAVAGVSGDGESVEPTVPTMTTAQAAKALRVHPSTVTNYISKGKLEAVARKGGTGYRVTVASVEAESERRAGKPGRRKKAVKRATAAAPERRGAGFIVPSEPGWLNVRDAAAILGISIQRVSDLAREGKYKSRLLAPRRALYEEASVRAYAEQRKSGAKPSPVDERTGDQEALSATGS